MLTFFRRIRKGLLDGGRTSKYLLYAIGEVLLVMIGILIALWVNNWNQDRIQRVSAEQHLNILKESLTDDIGQLESLIQTMDTMILYASRLLDQLLTIKPVDLRTGDYIIQGIFENSLQPNRNGLQVLNNSGEMAHLDHQIQQLVLNYYSVLELIKEQEEISNTYIRMHYEPYNIDKYGRLYRLSDKYRLSGDPRPIPAFDEMSFLEDAKLEVMVYSRRIQSERTKNRYIEAKSVALQIISRIESHEF